ncbi:basic helix-loop-helix protein [Ranunculus cassubicifolius]
MDLIFSDDSSSFSSSVLFSSSEHPVETVSPKRSAGRKIFKETRHPIYRGVRKRNGCKWVCEVREPNKKSRIWLGTYATPEMAARAYDVAALALRGESTPLNFTDSAWLLPRPCSASAVDIRATAYEAAKEFAPITKLLTSLSSHATCVKLVCVKSEEEVLDIFWDEEAMFSMPNFLDNMAEGLLLAPPCILDWKIDMSLWPDY